MLRLVWTTEARDDLHTILAYIAERNPTAADHLRALIEHTAESLPRHPLLSRSGRVPGTREAVIHPNYVLVYQVGAQEIVVLGVLHARQQYP